jgi:hypothetical protein
MWKPLSGSLDKKERNNSERKVYLSDSRRSNCMQRDGLLPHRATKTHQSLISYKKECVIRL